VLAVGLAAQIVVQDVNGAGHQAENRHTYANLPDRRARKRPWAEEKRGGNDTAF
jgi:hypothetical protein